MSKQEKQASRQSSQSEPVALKALNEIRGIVLAASAPDETKLSQIAQIVTNRELWALKPANSDDMAIYNKIAGNLAAPQQAIPSGLIETLKFYANKANYKTSWDSDSNHVMEDKGEIARNALAAYESAAPTAPIESDK
jgi:hypothetical protein